MKVFLLSVVLLVGALIPARAQFTNNAPFFSPPSAYPQIDSTNFVNLSPFYVQAPVTAPLTFSDVLFYTNRSALYCNSGFTFADIPSGSGTNRPSALFGNSSLGTVYAGAGTSVSYNFVTFDEGIYTFVYSPPLTIWATNVINAGLLDAGAPAVIDIMGNTVNLARGTIQIEGFSDYSTITSNNNSSPSIGIFDNFFGIGNQSNVLSQANFDPTGTVSSASTFATPGSTITFVGGVTVTNGFVVSLAQGSAAGYAWMDVVGPKNFTTEVVLVNTNLTGISVDVRRNGGGSMVGFGVPYIRWQAVVSNSIGLPTITNTIYLADRFGVPQTNYLVTNGFTISGLPEPAPYNYFFTRADPGFSGFAAPNFLPYNATTLFGNAFGTNAPPPVETNAYSAYEVSVDTVAYQKDPTAIQSSPTNVPGRLLIDASTSLDLTLTKISGPNYLNIQATNHFVGAANAVIISPFYDLNLGSTNGNLVISNVVYPTVPRINGTIDLYSCRWTNVDIMTNTNTFHVLIAGANLSTTAPAVIFNLGLRSTNIVVGDVLDVETNAVINATTLTITTNSGSAYTTEGQLDLIYPGADWTTTCSGLQYLTNFGFIDIGESGGFATGLGGIDSGLLGTGTFYDSLPTYAPYASLVNHGQILSGSISVWANYLENSSPYPSNSSVALSTTYIAALGGTVSLQASNAVLYNSVVISTTSDVSLTCANLSLSNQNLSTAGALTFTFPANGNLTDGGLTSTNNFLAAIGLNLLSKPATGDFLDSVITLAVPGSAEAYNTWAGANLGISPSGFQNNGAVGRLIVSNGNAFSQLYFNGPDANAYAMYVDLLDLRKGATNFTISGGATNYNAFVFGQPNFTIYYADAISGGVDIAEQLNGANGGQLVWVPAYVGRFSGTNIVSGGVTNRINHALAISSDIDSDADGVPNSTDTTPYYTASNVNLTIGITNLPPHAPVLHWNLLGKGSSNFVYFKTNLSSPTWTVLTNIMTNGLTAPYTFVDRTHTNGSVYYRLLIEPAQP